MSNLLLHAQWKMIIVIVLMLLLPICLAEYHTWQDNREAKRLMQADLERFKRRTMR